MKRNKTRRAGRGRLTLLIGVVASLITAVFISRFLCKQVLRLGATGKAWYTR